MSLNFFIYVNKIGERTAYEIKDIKQMQILNYEIIKRLKFTKTALIKIAQNWKKPSCPSIGEWLNKLWYIHIMQCIQ